MLKYYGLVRVRANNGNKQRRKNYYRILLKAVSEIGLDKPIMIEKDIFEASPDAEFYELTDENIDHFFGE